MTNRSDRAWLHQLPYTVRVEWGPRAAFEATLRRDVVVLVDVLSFTTVVSAALDVGAALAPFEWGRGEAAQREAKRIGARMGTRENTQRRALSPLSFSEADRGGLYLLCSPNGATCSRIAREAPATLAGALRNATSVAKAAERAADALGTAVTVVPCGEVWPGDEASTPEQRIRPCVEDALGAGAIAAACEGTLSPEAQLLANAFRATRPALEQTLLDCVGGRELREHGYEDDVRYSAQHDVSGLVPVLRDARFVPATR